MYYASRYQFGRVAGIEVEDSLYQIAVKNFDKLKMPQIEIFHPFDDDIYRAVIDRIFTTLTPSRKDSRVYIICYGASITKYIQSRNIVKLVSSYIDPVRDKSVNIWQWKKSSH